MLRDLRTGYYHEGLGYFLQFGHDKAHYKTEFVSALHSYDWYFRIRTMSLGASAARGVLNP